MPIDLETGSITCDYPGCTKLADFQQDKSTTPEGYHKYWCEEHDTLGRKLPKPPDPVVIERIVERVVEKPAVVRFNTSPLQHPGIYGKRPR